ncbi:hypothetical protein C8Q74DRAFT_492540 [Fomes fomentarius]|nr:hypothetical protein C8Q74DRAFT_492540 [Fomes fomentarius]
MRTDGTATANLNKTTTSVLASLSSGILSTICSHCSQATLSSLSTICRSVSTTALQQLWAWLESFGSLIYTLPSDAWRATETDRAVTLYVVRDLTPSDFTRFHFYAPFVDRVGIRNRLLHRKHLVVDASAWDALHNCPLGHLPNLCRASLSVDNNEDSYRAAARLISTLSGSSPNVTYFQLEVLGTYEGEGTYGLVEDAIEGFVLRIKDATKFLVGVAIRPPGLWQLSTFASLHELRLQLYSRHHALDTSCERRPERPFPSLRNLSVSTDSVHLLGSFLRNIQSSQIQAVVITTTQALSNDEFRFLAEALGRHPSCGSITQLCLGLGHGKKMQPVHRINAEAFALLFALGALERFTLQGSSYPAIDDTAFCEMIKSWPSIEELAFPIDGPHTGVTFAGLACLMQHPTKLEMVCLALADVDVSSVEMALQLGSEIRKFSESPLSRIHVGRPTISEAHVIQIASVLSAWFPSMWGVGHGWRMVWSPAFEELGPEEQTVEQSMRARWITVRNLVVAFAQVRMQERTWARRGP